MFYNCEFQQEITFYGVDFDAPVFSKPNTYGNIEKRKISKFHIENCSFLEEFTLNNCFIGEFTLDNSIFHSKFEFKENMVDEFNVFDTSHLKFVDMHATKFEKFNIDGSIFEDFVGFENCEFGVNNGSEEYVSKFTYATFLGFVNFRNTKYDSGLNIASINFKESPNFLNIWVNPSNTNRETFRIIKHSFDKIGNRIEANKYFVYEMKKYKEELKNSHSKQERAVLFLNEKISDFGQSYIKPTLWIIATSIIYYLLILGYENNILYNMYPPANNAFSAISEVVNRIAENILPFKKFLKDGMEFISLLFHIIFAGLIWQTIVAIKRHTRR